jgi:DNA-binding FrmR family transcriptional regulator
VSAAATEDVELVELDGMTCASCATRIERKLNALEGASATVNFASEQAYVEGKDALIKRLHRIGGQVRGIERMVAEERYCIDILTQVAAATTALEGLAFTILDGYVRHCVAGALASGDTEIAVEKSRELLEALRRFAKTS